MKNQKQRKKKTRKRRRHIPAPSGLGPLRCSNGVLVGNTFYLAGHLGVDSSTRKVPGTLEREIELMVTSFKNTLAQAGMTLKDLVVQVLCSDVSLFDQFNAAYRAHFGEPFPARAFIGSGPPLFGAHFEIQGIAVKA